MMSNNWNDAKWMLVPLAVGLFFIGIGLYFILNDLATQNWAQIDGKIISSNLYVSKSRTGILYSPDLVYQYSQGGLVYNGTCCSDSSPNKKEMQDIVAGNPIGKTVEVLYDPAAVWQSRMKDDIKPFEFYKLLITGFGFFCSLGSAIIFFYLLKPDKPV